MDTGHARRLFEEHSGALAYVEVEGPNGELSIGSAFHVGEGVFVTARHVVEGKRIREVCMTETFDVEPTPEESATVKAFTANGPIHNVNNGLIEIKSGPHYHEDSRVDVAVFRAGRIDPRTPVIPLGTHLDEYLGPDSFVLTEAIILGYPPIPMTIAPVLVGARAEINALAPLYDAPHLHFILSATARGGFSGGVVFSEHNYALGLVTRSLLAGNAAVESGFMAVLGVRAIYECLSRNKMLPAVQSDYWDGYWNTDYLTLTGPEANPGPGVKVTAMISAFNDGKRSYLEISCDQPLHLDMAVRSALLELGDRVGEYSMKNERTCKITVPTIGDSADDATHRSGQAASSVLLNAGYRAIYKRKYGADTLLPPHV
ncbi:trypsin-like peptidase domain-containing protein [Streptomyces fungicidicus]|uniref:trypsin-like peptidase domain-containing protein n=1 Tax=Streptomyces fungicidicus TaxID=68203 RepID=UPI0036532D12